MDPPKKGLQGAYPHCRRPWSTILACTRAWDELEHGVRLLPLQRPLKIFSELTFYDDGFFYNCRSVCDIANRFVYTLIMAYVTNAFKLKQCPHKEHTVGGQLFLSIIPGRFVYFLVVSYIRELPL